MSLVSNCPLDREVYGYLFNQLSDKMRRYAQSNGWIDENGRPIDSSKRDRAAAVEGADVVSKGATYSAAACTLSVVCAPAVPVLAGVGLGTGIAKDFIFDQNPASFFSDFGVDKALEKIGTVLKIPAVITQSISEGIKDSREFSDWKTRQTLRKD